MDPGIVGAIITAAVAVVVAVGSAVWSNVETRRDRTAREGAEERLKRLESDLAVIQGEQAARISYEYEARKRLYVEVGALQFQLGEAAEDARQRVVSLARSARKGNLDPGSGWLAANDYYMRTTTYYLFAPLAILRLIQRRLTSIDLDLDDKVKAQYQLLRVLSWSFSEGHELAKGLEEEYEPIWDKSHWADLRGEAERKHRPQHLPLGNIAKPVEALIVEGAAGAPARILSYGEFVRDPDRGRAKADDLESYLEPRDDIAEQCRWRDDQPTEEARRPFDAAHALLSTKLEGVRNPLSRQ